MKADNLAEEMRILYVAMTRAKEKLILTGMLMDTHDAPNVRIFVLQCRFAVIHLILFQLLHIAQKMIQAEVARLLVVR